MMAGQPLHVCRSNLTGLLKSIVAWLYVYIGRPICMVGFSAFTWLEGRTLHGWGSAATLRGCRSTVIWPKVDRFHMVCESTVACVVGRPLHAVQCQQLHGFVDQPTNRPTDQSATTVTMEPPPKARPLPCVACAVALRVPLPPPTAEPGAAELCALSVSSYRRRRGRLAILKCWCIDFL